MRADQTKLHECGDDEEEDGDDRDSEGSGVQAAGGVWSHLVGVVLIAVCSASIVARDVAVRVTRAEWCVEIARAARAITRHDSNGNECSCKEDVEDESDDAEEGDAAEAAGQDNGKDGVESRCSRETLDSLLPCRNVVRSIGLNGEEVRVDAEHDSCAAEGDEVEEGLEQPEESSFDETHDGWWCC